MCVLSLPRTHTDVPAATVVPMPISTEVPAPTSTEAPAPAEGYLFVCDVLAAVLFLACSSAAHTKV